MSPQIGVSDSELISELAHEAAREAATTAREVERLGSGIVISGQHSGRILTNGGVRCANVVVTVEGVCGQRGRCAVGVVEDTHSTLTSLAVGTGRERIEVPIDPR